jgi:dihydroflavonol-4-reductase
VSSSFANTEFFEYTSISEESQRNALYEGDTSISTVLVTGGTGFVGSHTIELLLQRGFHVRCLVRRSRTNLGWVEGLPIEVLRGSYYDVDSLREAVGQSDYVIHLAGVTKARKQREYNDGNVLATRNLLEAATSSSKLRKFCYISSLTAVGPSRDGSLIDENAPCAPLTTYGVTKLEAETICHLYANRIPLVILRPPAVYGPRDSDLLEIFKWAVKGFVPAIGGRKKTMSLIFGPELGRAIVEATLSEKTAGETYFVSDTDPYSYIETAGKVSALAGKRTRVIPLPRWLVYTMGGVSEALSAFRSAPPVLNIEKVRDLIQNHWVCTPRKLQDHLGFSTQVSIDEGLKRTYEWYKGYGWL